MNEKLNARLIVKKMSILIALSISWSLLIATFITGHLWDLTNLRVNLASLRIWTTLNRAYILFFLFLFVGTHFIFPYKLIYKFLFSRRWFVGVFLLLFLTINQYHGDSIGVYSEVIQTGTVPENATEIFGESRAIRSDEYVVTTPAILASGYGDNAYGKYNSISRGTDTLNIVNGIYGGYATLGYSPWELSYLILPVEYAFSFCWYAPLILGFLMIMELFFIISKKELLSATGAFLVICSSFYLWWGFSAYYFAGPGTIVCLYYFLKSEKKRNKIFCSFGMAICFSTFVTNLYPAWQVPLGYVFLVIGLWVLKCNWNAIKRLNRKEWLILGGGIFFCLSLIISYLMCDIEYIQSILNTVYPGSRTVTGGGFDIAKQFYYAQAPFYAYSNVGNPSECGVFFSLFPVPTIISSYIWAKKKKKDFLVTALLIVEVIMLVYVTIGLPEVLAKVLLLSYSTTGRVNDIIGFIQIILIIILFSIYEKEIRLPKSLAVIISLIVGGICVAVSRFQFTDYLSIVEMIIAFLVIVLCGIGIMIQLTERQKRCLFTIFIAVSVFTGIYIRPVMRGLDAIYSRPVAKEIFRIQENDQDAKWFSMGREPFLSAFNISCGASTINSVNTYPNLELWRKLDTNRKYETIYNRFARVEVELTEKSTSFELLENDTMQVNLSYKDIEKTGVTYLLVGSEEEININNGYVDFEKVYEHDNVLIYHLTYDN